MASRVEPEKVSPRELQRRSATIGGFWLIHAFARPEILARAYAELAAQVAAGELRVICGGDHPMPEVRQAHEAPGSRRTTGKLVIDPRR